MMTSEKEGFSQDPPPGVQLSSKSSKRLLGVVLAVVAVLAVVLSVVFGTQNGDNGDNANEVVRIESYAVSTTIHNRFATTRVDMTFVNRGNCSAVHGFTMQLPKRARVKSLTMKALDCVFDSDVQTVKEAYQTFQDQAAQGKPAALLEAWDTSDYHLQVSIHALGSTTVELVYEELLMRRSHRIPVHVPVSPGRPVDHLHAEISITELEAGVSKFAFDDWETMDASIKNAFRIKHSKMQASASLDIDGVVDNKAVTALPRLLRGWYDSSDIPENGLLIQSEQCLLHLFNPMVEGSGTLQPLPRSLVFVIDVSGSMAEQNKLKDAKAAFANVIGSLSSQDYFAVHTFSNKGTEKALEPALATEKAKARATKFVHSLKADGSTNLNDAFVDGIEKMKYMTSNEAFWGHVPILIILTDGQGETFFPTLARNIKAANQDVGAKIYCLAFGRDAELNLLKGISIQNKGKAVEIFEGFFDAADQIEDFYDGELGSIFLSDIDIHFQGSSDFRFSTKTAFPVLPGGSEVVVRAILSKSSNGRGLGGDDNSSNELGSFNVTTTAVTSTGPLTWMASSQPALAITDGKDIMGNDCYQSFAHSRITEILDFRDAAISLGEQMAEYAPFDLPADFNNPRYLPSIANEQAIEIAIEASVVWPGLTALVTLESESCADILEDINVCHDGDSMEGVDSEDDVKEAYSGVQYGYNTPAASTPTGPPQNLFPAADTGGGVPLGAGPPQSAWISLVVSLCALILIQFVL